MKLVSQILVISVCCWSATCANAQQSAGSGSSTGRLPEHGLAVGDWLLYPELSTGVSVNDNVFRKNFNQKTQAGFTLSPSFVAVRDAGIHKTTVFGSLEAQTYGEVGSATNLQGQFGFSHDYEAERDLLFHVDGKFTRQIGAFGNLANSELVGTYSPSGALPLIVIGSPFIGNLFASNRPSNQFNGSVSVEKKFGRAFVDVFASAQALRYDGVSTLGLNGQTYSIGARGGYWISPQIYSFVETAMLWHQYSGVGLDSHGYRVLTGLGTDQLGLFRGQVYVGLQSQSGATLVGNSQLRPVVGGQLSYYPTSYLTFIAQVDQDLGVAAPSVIVAQYTTSTRASLAAQYAFSPYWSANSRFGALFTRFQSDKTHDQAWFAGLGLSYTFWRNVALTADYQHVSSISHVSASSYRQNIYTIGMNYRY